MTPGTPAEIVNLLVPIAEAAAGVREAVERALTDPTLPKPEFEQAIRGGRGVLAPKGPGSAGTQRARIAIAWEAIAAAPGGISLARRGEILASAVVAVGPLDGGSHVHRTITFPRAGPASQVRFVYNKERKTLYVEIYEVDQALAGNHLGTDYLRRALLEAEQFGPVEVVAGKAGQTNAQKRLTERGKLDGTRIGGTPWAKAWGSLGWTTELVGTVMTTTRTDRASQDRGGTRDA